MHNPIPNRVVDNVFIAVVVVAIDRRNGVVVVVGTGLLVVELVVGLRHAAPGLKSTDSLKSVHKLSSSFGPSSTNLARANGAYVAGDSVLESSEYSSFSSAS